MSGISTGNALPDMANRTAAGSRPTSISSLKTDQFFVLGDNSAKSKDGRLWGPDHCVPRDLLIGKALFIYWPHSWDRLPYVNSIPFPYFPNFSRMGLVSDSNVQQSPIRCEAASGLFLTPNL